MLDQSLVKQIEEFVYSKPRSVQEIAQLIKKNWRTADRYVSEIEREYGTLATRVFREGTRGALKVVHWASIEKASSSAFQEQLEKQILNGKTKYDFSPFDIFQFVPDKNKKAKLEVGKKEPDFGLEDLKKILLSAKKQILIFSGNLSFLNYKDKKTNIFKIFEELSKKNISIKIVSRIDIAGLDNVKRALSINFEQGKENIEIRHSEQPLRAIIVDKQLFNIKEIKEPTGREGELKNKTFIFYTIKDKAWTEWLSRIFWKIFSSSIGVQKRLDELSKIF
jgi:hypothetical protein